MIGAFIFLRRKKVMKDRNQVSRINDIEKYREFCKKDPSIPIYLKDWWLDAVCGDQHWEVNLIKLDGKIVAAHPFFRKSKFGFKVISTPLFTPFLGVWFK